MTDDPRTEELLRGEYGLPRLDASRERRSESFRLVILGLERCQRTHRRCISDIDAGPGAFQPEGGGLRAIKCRPEGVKVVVKVAALGLASPADTMKAIKDAE